MQKPKHEYEVLIKYAETHRVFVEAEDEEQACELALDKYNEGETEISWCRTDAEVNWSDEEPEARCLDEEG